jgi:hypothetical protein
MMLAVIKTEITGIRYVRSSPRQLGTSVSEEPVASAFILTIESAEIRLRHNLKNPNINAHRWLPLSLPTKGTIIILKYDEY